jgi:hypothetical protein
MAITTLHPGVASAELADFAEDFEKKRRGILTTADVLNPDSIQIPTLVEVSQAERRQLDIRTNSLAQLLVHAARYDTAWNIALPRKLTAYTALYDPLIAQYEQANSDSSDHYLLIPTGDVTRAAGTAGFSGAEVAPILDISVPTAADIVPTIFGAEGEPELAPTQGSWYRLPLQQTGIELIAVGQ